MDTDELKNIVEGLEIATRLKEIREYVSERREEVWNSMLDLSNSITPGNRRDCARKHAKLTILLNILNDLVQPVARQNPDKMDGLYRDLVDDIRL